MFDFPNAPVLNQQVLEPNGAVLRWDGVKWVNAAGQVSSVTPTYNNVGRNLLHNPLFNIAQRGVGAFTANGSYTVDRWAISFGAGETNSVTRVGMTDTGRAAIGDEAAQFILGNTFTGAAGAANYNQVFQRLEGVRRLAGKTVTVSFWANSTIASLKVGVSFNQYFGSGGSPSTGVTGAGQSATLSSSAGTWTMQVLTLAIPSAAGKTLGTNGDDFTQFNLWFSAGASNATASGSVGVQSGYIGLWGVQLEIGSVATPLEKPDPQQDLAKCQRFYQSSSFGMWLYTGVGTNLLVDVQLPVQMRAAPTIVTSGVNQSNCTGAAVTAVGSSGYQTFATGTALGQMAFNGSYTASADL
jgi:hypothetical protein